MLRGFRWQFLALILAAILFVISLLTRTPSNDGGPVVISSAGPSIQTETSPVIPPSPTLPASQPTVSQPAPVFADGIPTYREALIGDVRRLNPLLAGLNPVDQDITSLIFEGLIRINQYGEPEPALAREWVISFDGLEYVLTLRDDVLWQDGEPFTADDVIFTMSLLSAPDFPGPESVGTFWRTVEVEKLGQHMVRFRLAQRLGSFLDALRVGILPVHALQGTPPEALAGHRFNLTPIGTGPYQLEAFRTDGDRIRAVDLRVSPVYRTRPGLESPLALERISFRLYDSFDQVVRALESGEVDGYAARSRGERLSLLAVRGDFGSYTTIEPVLGVIMFNWTDDNLPYFRDMRVRQALQTGLERTSIIERHLLNLAVRADSPLLQNSWAYAADLPWPAYSVETARSLLDRANIRPVVPEGEEASEQPAARFAFSILTLNDPALVNVAQEIATQWDQLNVDAEVEAVDQATFLERLESGQFGAALVELSMSGSADPDVYAFWHQGQYPDGLNYGGANDRPTSEQLERARSDADGTNRIQHYRLFQQEFIQRAVAIPLFYPLYTYVITDRLQGLQLGFVASPQDRFLTIQNWEIAAP